MKTRLMSEIQRELGMVKMTVQFVFFIICAAGLPLFAVAASDPGYETSLRQKKRDFERYIANRDKKTDTEAKAAEALRKARVAKEKQQAELEKKYQKTMKRYSMEEIEKKDRQDEERLAKLRVENDAARSVYRRRREQHRVLEAEIRPVDPYREFDINMAVEPESKATHVESKAQ